MEIAILFWVVLCFAAGMLASKRGRSSVIWFAVALFLSPLVAGIFLLVLRDLSRDVHLTGVAAAIRGQGVSRADELAKLAELRDKGVLTPKEFDRQKKALLAAGPT